jgi:Cysteine-rich CWC
MRGPVDKRCEHCGQAFTCGQYGCWCGRMAITDAQLDWIARRFQDCLCPDCLHKVSTGELGPSRERPSQRR